MLAFEDVCVNLFILLPFLSLLCCFERGFIDFLWRDVVQGLFDDFIHVEYFDSFLAAVALLQLLGNRFLAGEGSAQDRKLEWQFCGYAQLTGRLLVLLSVIDFSQLLVRRLLVFERDL